MSASSTNQTQPFSVFDFAHLPAEQWQVVKLVLRNSPISHADLRSAAMALPNNQLSADALDAVIETLLQNQVLTRSNEAGGRCYRVNLAQQPKHKPPLNLPWE